MRLGLPYYLEGDLEEFEEDLLELTLAISFPNLNEPERLEIAAVHFSHRSITLLAATLSNPKSHLTSEQRQDMEEHLRDIKETYQQIMATLEYSAIRAKRTDFQEDLLVHLCGEHNEAG